MPSLNPFVDPRVPDAQRWLERICSVKDIFIEISALRLHVRGPPFLKSYDIDLG